MAARKQLRPLTQILMLEKLLSDGDRAVLFELMRAQQPKKERKARQPRQPREPAKAGDGMCAECGSAEDYAVHSNPEVQGYHAFQAGGKKKAADTQRP